MPQVFDNDGSDASMVHMIQLMYKHGSVKNKMSKGSLLCNHYQNHFIRSVQSPRHLRPTREHQSEWTEKLEEE